MSTGRINLNKRIQSEPRDITAKLSRIANKITIKHEILKECYNKQDLLGKPFLVLCLFVRDARHKVPNNVYYYDS